MYLISGTGRDPVPEIRYLDFSGRSRPGNYDITIATPHFAVQFFSEFVFLVWQRIFLPYHFNLLPLGY